MKTNKVLRPDLIAGLNAPRSGVIGANFIGADILPMVGVPKKAHPFFKSVFSDKALTIDIDGLARAAKADYQTLNYRTTADTATTEDEGLQDLVDDVQEAEVVQQFDAEQDMANGVFLNLQRATETAYGSYLFDAASLFVSYTNDVTIEWDTPATAIVYSDVGTAFDSIIARIGGVLPAGVELCLAVSKKVFLNMANTVDIRTRRAGGYYNAKGTPQKAPNAAEMADVLDIDQVFVGGAKNGSTDIWDDEYALAFLRYTGSDVSIPQLGRTFYWGEDGDSQFIAETYRSEPRGTVVLVRNNVKRYAFNAECGQLLGNITS